MLNNGVTSDHIPTMVRFKWLITGPRAEEQHERKYRFPKKEDPLWTIWWINLIPVFLVKWKWMK
ncbi:hypothetical protein D3C80_2009790 [compost metagenome]